MEVTIGWRSCNQKRRRGEKSCGLHKELLVTKPEKVDPNDGHAYRAKDSTKPLKKREMEVPRRGGVPCEFWEKELSLASSTREAD